MLNPRFHWYEPPEFDVREYWIEWLNRKANHCARVCAYLVADNSPGWAEKYALKFEIYDERALLLQVEPAEVVEIR